MCANENLDVYVAWRHVCNTKKMCVCVHYDDSSKTKS